jgi:hypothetical protein
MRSVGTDSKIGVGWRWDPDTGLIEKSKAGKLTIVDLPEIFNLETALSGGYSRSGDLVLR